MWTQEAWEWQTRTSNRAELTGIAAALTIKYAWIATDSACFLSQIRKQLLFPEMQRDHIHSNLLEQIVSLIYAFVVFLAGKPPNIWCIYTVLANPKNLPWLCVLCLRQKYRASKPVSPPPLLINPLFYKPPLNAGHMQRHAAASKAPSHPAPPECLCVSVNDAILCTCLNFVPRLFFQISENTQICNLF